jgi:hypothetical protein
MAEKTIDAINVREGQTVTRIVANERSPFLRRRIKVDQDIEQTNGRWPTVIERDYLERGEGGRPTVYLTLSNSPEGVFPLMSDDQVTVIA